MDLKGIHSVLFYMLYISCMQNVLNEELTVKKQIMFPLDWFTPLYTICLGATHTQVTSSVASYDYIYMSQGVIVSTHREATNRNVDLLRKTLKQGGTAFGMKSPDCTTFHWL